MRRLRATRLRGLGHRLTALAASLLGHLGPSRCSSCCCTSGCFRRRTAPPTRPRPTGSSCPSTPRAPSSRTSSRRRRSVSPSAPVPHPLPSAAPVPPLVHSNTPPHLLQLRLPLLLLQGMHTRPMHAPIRASFARIPLSRPGPSLLPLRYPSFHSDTLLPTPKPLHSLPAASAPPLTRPSCRACMHAPMHASPCVLCTHTSLSPPRSLAVAVAARQVPSRARRRDVRRRPCAHQGDLPVLERLGRQRPHLGLRVRRRGQSGRLGGAMCLAITWPRDAAPQAWEKRPQHARSRPRETVDLAQRCGLSYS